MLVGLGSRDEGRAKQKERKKGGTDKQKDKPEGQQKLRKYLKCELNWKEAHFEKHRPTKIFNESKAKKTKTQFVAQNKI